eukprot:11032060-Lingulodinium_polyedra.AAC.1
MCRPPGAGEQWSPADGDLVAFQIEAAPLMQYLESHGAVGPLALFTPGPDAAAVEPHPLGA